MEFSHRLALFGLVFVSLGAAGCGGGDLPPAFPLAWSGVESSPSLTDRGRGAVGSKTFHFERIVDRRADATKVGTDEETKYAFRTNSNVGTFVSDKVKQLIGDAGLKLGETGDYTIQGELLAYEVNEGNRFEAEVRILMRVFKPRATAFEQTYVGKASTFGRTHSTDNMNEALSAAMLSAVSLFLHDDLFADFLEGKGAAAAPAAPAASASAPAAPAKPAPSAAPKAGPRTL